MNKDLQETSASAMDTPQLNRRYVSVMEAVSVLNVSREALYKKLKKGELPHFKFGRKILIDIDEVMEAIRAK